MEVYSFSPSKRIQRDFSLHIEQFIGCNDDGIQDAAYRVEERENQAQRVTAGSTEMLANLHDYLRGRPKRCPFGTSILHVIARTTFIGLGGLT